MNARLRAHALAVRLDAMEAAACDDHAAAHTLREIGELVELDHTFVAAVAAHVERAAAKVREGWPLPPGHWADWSSAENREYDTREEEAEAAEDRAAEEFVARAERMIASMREMA